MTDDKLDERFNENSNNKNNNNHINDNNNRCGYDDKTVEATELQDFTNYPPAGGGGVNVVDSHGDNALTMKDGRSKSANETTENQLMESEDQDNRDQAIATLDPTNCVQIQTDKKVSDYY